MLSKGRSRQLELVNYSKICQIQLNHSQAGVTLMGRKKLMRDALEIRRKHVRTTVYVPNAVLKIWTIYFQKPVG